MTTAVVAQNDYIFFTGNYEQLQKRAKNSGKPYFVYLYANWCIPAKEMNEQTFTSKYLKKFGEKNFLAMQVDGESIISDGKKIADKYKVRYFPTILIFSSKGKELKRMVGFQSAKTLLDELKKYKDNHEEPEPPKKEVNTEKEPTKKEVSEGEFLFRIAAKRQALEGFGVQVGVYSSYRNAFARLLELEEKYFHRNLMVHVRETKDGKSVFKLILGPFSSEEQAKEYAGRLKKKDKIEGIPIDLSKLK